MTTEFRSRIWVIESSVSAHCCFEKSVLLFPVPKTDAEANSDDHQSGKAVSEDWWRSDAHRATNLFETLGMSDEDLAAVIQCLRAKYDAP